MVEFALPDEALEYSRILSGESREIRADVPMDRLVAELDGLSGVAAGELKPAPAVQFIEHARTAYGASVAGACAKLIVLKLIEDYPSRVRRIALPESIRELYPRTLHRIARGLMIVAHEAYIAESGDFWRDLRLSAQLTVPLTASRVVDRTTFLPRTFYRNMGPAENLRCLRFIALRLHGLGPVFRTHINERDLSEFNDAGYDRAYLRAAEMLRLYPKVKGMVGTSWTLDPQLDHISPKFSYARRCQIDHGAFLRFDGPSEEATRRALVKSPTRRALYERGEYTPVTCTIVWPRRGVLRWAAGKATAA